MNYVNNVNVGGSMYALGPLMSTSSGGIVDNKSDAYSEYNNCIIHANVYDDSASMIDSNLVLNTNVSVGAGTALNNAVIIGGGGMSLESGYSCDYAAFINCDTSDACTIYCGGVSGNTFIGLHGYSVNSGFDTNLLLRGANNIVQGYARCVSSAGFHAVATKTVNLYQGYAINTDIQFPYSCCGVCTIAVVNREASTKFDFIVKNWCIQGDANVYSSSDFYYYAYNDNVGVSISDGTGYLYLYTDYPVSGATQVTLSYDVVPCDVSSS